MVCGVKPRELDELAPNDTDETDAEYTNGTKDTHDMGGMDIGNGICENEHVDMQQEFEFDDDLFGMSKTKEKKSRTQKRKEKENWRESSMGTSEKEKVRAGKIFSVLLATMEPLPKNQSPNWNQDLKPGRQSRTPKRTVVKRCKKNTRTGTLSEKCKTLCTYCASKVFAEKLENKCMKG